MILDDSDLTMMRGIAELSLTETCTIKRDVKVSDGHGGQSVSLTTVETTVCKKRTLSGDVNTVGAAEDEINLVAIAFPFDTDVQAKDHVVIDGETFTVTKVKKLTYEVLRQVEARLD